MTPTPEEQTQEFMDEFENILDHCQRLCWITRGRELLVEGREVASVFKAKVSALKQDAVARVDEESANMLLSMEEILEACIHELEMWIALKDDNPNAAWDHLVSAQMAARDALLAHQMAEDLHVEGYIDRLHVIEQVIYPPQVFASIGAVVDYAECSICGQEYGTCDHVVGQPYMGRLCSRVIKNFRELREISIVQAPASKRHRAYQTTDTHGVFRDVMTWRPVPADSPSSKSANDDQSDIVEGR